MLRIRKNQLHIRDVLVETVLLMYSLLILVEIGCSSFSGKFACVLEQEHIQTRV
jgi:hypothetical protein